MKLFNLKSLVLPLSLLLAVVILFPSCQPDDTPDIPTNLSETLKTYSELSTLVEALEVTNLTSQLDQATVTIFAPTNTAFDAFLANAGATQLSELDVVELKNILLNHVLDGYITSDVLVNGYENTSAIVQGFPASIKVDVDALSLNNTSTITSFDIDGLTGVIHVVDQVVDIPDVVDLVNNDGNFGSLVESLATVDLVNSLQTEGPYTVFAPTDDAIQWSTSMGLDLELLEAILALHVVEGNVRAEDLFDDQLIENFAFLVDGTDNYTIRFGTDGTTQIVETGSNPERIIARINMTNLQGRNGVVHVIDNVIIL